MDLINDVIVSDSQISSQTQTREEELIQEFINDPEKLTLEDLDCI